MKRAFDYLLEPPVFLGRRGAVLLLLGIIWILIGWDVLQSEESVPFETNYIYHQTLPIWFRTSLWFLSGGLAVILSYRKFANADFMGYGGLIILPLERFASYLWSWVISLPIWPDGIGNKEGLGDALIWGTIALLIYTCAGWREPIEKTLIMDSIREGEAESGRRSVD